MIVKREENGKMAKNNCTNSHKDTCTGYVDVVRQPEHYKHGTYEVIDEMLIVFGPKKTFDFCTLNAWKYRARAPFKGKMEEDMEKSSRYLEMAKQIADRYEDAGPATIRLIKEDSDGTGK